MKNSSDWLAECDSCGFVYYSSQLRKRWDGLMVCKKDYEPRHPSDFYRYKSMETSLPFIRDRKINYRCYATLSADVTPTTDAWTLLGLNTEIADALAEFTTGTSTFRPNSTASREFRFGVAISNISGVYTLNVALYKNGTAVKTLSEINGSNEGEARLAGMYIDSSATSTDDYTVYYYITGSAVTIEARDSGSYLEVK